jgi:hypothetical protein
MDRPGFPCLQKARIPLLSHSARRLSAMGYLVRTGIRRKNRNEKY